VTSAWYVGAIGGERIRTTGFAAPAASAPLYEKEEEMPNSLIYKGVRRQKQAP